MSKAHGKLCFSSIPPRQRLVACKRGYFILESSVAQHNTGCYDSGAADEDGYCLGFQQRVSASHITNTPYYHRWVHTVHIECLRCLLPFPVLACRPVPTTLSLPSLFMHSSAGGCKNSLLGGVGVGVLVNGQRVGISNEEELALCWQQWQDTSAVKWWNRDRSAQAEAKGKWALACGLRGSPPTDGSL